ncbi:MAG TPA: HAD-IA family hydrolase [Clostridia bacterium]|jgi:phosphoglycolate phosphatase|nr:HAD-IA family hydrolase [Clostridia bacterium]HXK71440.1 HAD-IA family hydrolase [Clostridia bacterium]
MDIKALIFDLDGTLLNTLEDLTDSMNYALSSFGYEEISIQQARSYVGNGAERYLELSLINGRENPDFQKCLDTFKTHYQANMENKTKPYDGILDLLNKVKVKGYQTAIVSNKFDDAVKQISPKYFNSYIDVAIGESEKIKKKPAPDSVYLALEKLGCDKSQALYIGDSDVDAKTASNSGLKFIGVSWGFRDKSILYELGAQTVIDHPSQLIKILEK